MDLTNRPCPRRAAFDLKLSSASKMNCSTNRRDLGQDHDHDKQFQGEADDMKKSNTSDQNQTSLLNTGKENQSSSQTSIEQNQQQQCHECNRSLVKSKHLVSISGQTNQWHPECFRCNICLKSMDEELSCHIYKNKIFCREDYLKLQRDLTIRCSRCHWPIGASDWVRKASQYVYHLACFSCDICQRQLSTGEQFTIRVHQKKNSVRLLCRLHFAIDTGNRSLQPQMPGMKATQLNREAGKMATDLERTNELVDDSSKCDSGHTVTPANGHEALVGQVNESSRFLHLLASSTSGQQQADLLSADEEQSGAIELGPGGHFNGSPPGSIMFKSSNHFLPDIDLGHAQHPQAHQQQHPHIMQNAHQQHISSKTSSNHHQAPSSITSNESSATNGSGAGTGSCHNLASLASKSKRVRTTFTEDQLAILQNHFQIDSNPDGQDLERIAVITGLTKRVTQVWFQNSRARQKKYMTKRKPNGTLIQQQPQQQQQLQTSTIKTSNNPASCLVNEVISSPSSSQQFMMHQQRIDTLIGGECSAHKKIVSVGGEYMMTNVNGPSTISSSVSSSQEDAVSQYEELDESRSCSVLDADDGGQDRLNNSRDLTLDDTTNED